MAMTAKGQVDIYVQTDHKWQVVDITAQVAEAIDRLGIVDGLCHVYVAHTTAAIAINEKADPNIGDDILHALDRLVPEGIWKHDQIDNNGAAHLKAALLGPSEIIPLQQGRLVLGTWQAVMLVEFDGPRQRRVVVSVR